MKTRHFLASTAIAMLAFAFTLTSPVLGQTPIVELSPPDCVPQDGNAVVRSQLAGKPAIYELRTYFRWEEHSNFYYLVMAAEADGSFWSVLPKPDELNEQVELYLTAHDASGKVLAKSSPGSSDVTEDCRVELTEKQAGYADNLVIGETSAAQIGEDVLGFRCDGIVTRIGVDGVLRADEVCRACVIGSVEGPVIAPIPPGVKAAVAAGGIFFGGGVVTTVVIGGEEPPVISPSEP